MTEATAWFGQTRFVPGQKVNGTMAGSRAIRLILVFLVTVQHSAFIYVPAFFSGREFDDLRGIDDPINAVCVALSALLAGALMLARPKAILEGLVRNPLLVAFMVLALASTLWSIHPDVTIKRAAGYVVTVGVALLLVTMMDFLGAMRVFATSFAIAAFGSLVLCVALPQYGIMTSNGDLSATWRGAYTHKEVLGIAMAIAVVVECAITLATRRLTGRHALIILLYLLLLVMSRAATAIFIAAFAISVTAIILSYGRSRLAGMLMLLSVLAVGLCGGYFALIDPETLLGLFGKDVGLTGRVELWQAVLDLIGQRPVLGWGYRATWVPTDQDVQYVDHITGGWGVTAAHNSYLEITLQLGLVGLGLLAVTVLRAAGLGWSRLRTNEPASGITMLMLIAILLSAGLVYEMVGLNQNITWLLFIVVMLGLNRPTAVPAKAGTQGSGA
ncbi:MAG TPA: O-antigen ligase family protein [Devosia sp.]|nr:O-antigen ligase family protein [Devosia sp.]